MNTQVLATATLRERETAIASAVEYLRRGDCVALPTETVYGLAADALAADAAVKIFEAKERPHFDPLIVHLPDQSWLDRLTAIPPRDQTLVDKLAAEFWPGPLTFVLQRRACVPDVVTAGLATVAVRISAHPVLTGVLKAFDGPLAAPSANRFGRISPTAASHVVEELDGRIPLIVDGGATTHGLESAIIAVRNSRIEILRRGPVTAEQLRAFANVNEPRRDGIEAPGQLPSHYAPRTRLVLMSEFGSSVGAAQRIGALRWCSADAREFTATRTLSPSQDLREAAANLFRYLRELDAAGLDLIVAEEVPETGLGAAINDRLRRAAAER